MLSRQRHCLYFPILHGTADLGEFETARTKSKADTDTDTRRHFAEIDAMWQEIEAVVPALNLDFTEAFLYQDGLPMCGDETRIVEDLARSGSRNHGLLATLLARGATLVGTESPELLVAEYELASQVLGAPGASPSEMRRLRARAADLLEQRDRFIARRIDETLPPGRTALLFIGALHHVDRHLPADISVSYPIGLPRQGTSDERTVRP